MKKILKLITLLSLLSLNVSAAVSTVEILLNNYVREQANKQVELLLPRGKFSVSVNVTADQAKIRSENEFQPVKLPLGSSFITGTELKATGGNDVSVERMLS